jgi:hypothetical protein
MRGSNLSRDLFTRVIRNNPALRSVKNRMFST